MASCFERVEIYYFSLEKKGIKIQNRTGLFFSDISQRTCYLQTLSQAYPTGQQGKYFTISELRNSKIKPSSLLITNCRLVEFVALKSLSVRSEQRNSFGESIPSKARAIFLLDSLNTIASSELDPLNLALPKARLQLTDPRRQKP